MNKRPIILLGGGGHCASVIEAAESAGVLILGILDICVLVCYIYEIKPIN